MITGATGYLGSVLASALSNVECELRLLALEKSPFVFPSGKAKVKFIAGDVSSADIWPEALEEADVVFHLAAFEHRYGSEFNPEADLRVNAGAVLNLLESCRKSKIFPRIVFSSSSNLFGRAKTTPVNEGFPDDPLNLYSIHKLAAEKYLRFYAEEFGVPSVALRLGNVYGPSLSVDLSLRATLNKIIKRGVGEESLKVFKNQNRLRDYIFIDDVTSAFLRAGSGEVGWDGRYYVVSGGEGKTLRQTMDLIVERLAAKTARRLEVATDDDSPIQAIEQRDFVADSRRFKEATGWSAAVSLTDGIDRTVDYFLKNK